MVLRHVFASSVESTSFWTKNTYPYWDYNNTWITPRQQWFTFEIQTTQWVTVALAQTPGRVSTDCFEVHIGSSMF